MDLTVQMKIFINFIHRQTFWLKFGDKVFTLLAMLGCEAKAST